MRLLGSTLALQRFDKQHFVQKELCSSKTYVTADCIDAEFQLLMVARHHGEDKSSKSSRCGDFLVSSSVITTLIVYQINTLTVCQLNAPYVCIITVFFFNSRRVQERCLTDINGPLREHVVVVGAFLCNHYTFSSLYSILNRPIEEL